jgi:hypothetical protein
MVGLYCGYRIVHNAPRMKTMKHFHVLLFALFTAALFECALGQQKFAPAEQEFVNAQKGRLPGLVQRS